METIYDIIREKRATADEIERKVNNQFSRELVKSLRKEADRIEKAHRREIETTRALIEGLLDASTTECASCDYDCGTNRENCICRQARGWLEGRRGE